MPLEDPRPFPKVDIAAERDAIRERLNRGDPLAIELWLTQILGERRRLEDELAMLKAIAESIGRFDIAAEICSYQRSVEPKA